ncbi:hypothetical protein [Paenibacillus kandeliae]|uniref:hypothetical protein n=1 Tax=Paenibacillus kandeliae TaxID=3231269 RepID=UPI00345A16EE
MPKWDEQTIKRHLDKEPEHTPDYEAMWSRIQWEADNRRSGWSRDDEPEMKLVESRKRSKRIAIVALSAVAAVSIGVWNWQYPGQSVGIPASIPVQASTSSPISLKAIPDIAQPIHTQVLQQGVGLSIQQAQLHFDSDIGNRATFQLQLAGVDPLDFTFATFAKASIIDMQTNKATYSSLMGFQKDQDVTTDEQFQLSRSVTQADQQSYVIKLQDLYLIQRKHTALPANIQLNKKYDVQAGQLWSLSFQKYEWSNDNKKLTVRYTSDKDMTHIPEVTIALQGYTNIGNYLRLQDSLENQSISKSMQMGNNGKRIVQEFEFKQPLTQKERDSVRLYFDYGLLTQQIKGTWRIPFTVHSE